MSQACYVLAQIDVKDLPRYRAEYGKHVVPLIEAHGGELLVATADAQALEGAWPGNWTVVIRFPSREQALGWYESEAYAPLKKLRIEGLAAGSGIVLVPGREGVG